MKSRPETSAIPCAIYARVSDETQVKGESIQHQISFCQEIARRRSRDERKTWYVSDSLIYVDEGITGTSFVKRPEVQRMIEDARRRKFQVVLFKGISRFARDTVDALMMLRMLLACDVRVISIEENFDSERDQAEFVFTIHSALAQAESEKTAIRVRMGAMEKARQGKWNGPAPDGYILNKQSQRLEIDPSRAPLIREIFALYGEGYGTKRIAAMLNQSGERTRFGNLWTQRTVSRLLENPVYMGDVTYGRRIQKPALPKDHESFVTRKTTVFTDNLDDVVVCRDAHAAIVDRHTFHEAKRVRAGRRTNRGQSQGGQLFSGGLLRCRCGGGMVIHYNTIGTRYYRCGTQHERGRSYCDQPFVRADDVESLLLDRVRVDLLSVLDFDMVKSGHTTRIHSTERQAIEKRMATLMKRTQTTFEQLSDGKMTDGQFQLLNAEIRREVDELRTKAKRLETQLDDGAVQLDSRQNLHTAIVRSLDKHTGDKDLTRHLLEQIVDGVTIDGHVLRIQYRFRPSAE